jgi:bifunctional enzyme CysN/CysC
MSASALKVQPLSAYDDNPAIAAFLAEQENKTLLRFLTCGSVDDGKSTLIGRLLYDTKLIFEDQLATLERDSKKHGTDGDNIDFALLVDGLEAEREQGITIDVAYRFFATPKRKFIVADTPGHIQYTRNMATGASTADLAIVLIDARQGVLTQTRRHSFIASLLGIKNIIVAVNKIDLVGWSEQVFNQIVADYQLLAKELSFKSIVPIPISARFGDNVTSRSGNMPWYGGPVLLDHLETVQIEQGLQDLPFRLPVLPSPSPNPARRPKSSASSRMTATSPTPPKARRSPSFSRTKSKSRAAICWSRPMPARMSPTSSPPKSSGLMKPR